MRLLTTVCCALAVALPFGLTLIPARGAAAATFNVNSLADTPDALSGDGICADAGGACTLRAAIEQANAGEAADAIGFVVDGTINLTGTLPDLSTDVTISGPGSSLLTVRRGTGGDYRIFTVRTAATVAISGLTVSNGQAPQGAFAAFSGGQGEPGGGISNSGTLTLTGCVVSGNNSGKGGFGLSQNGRGGHGGGIYNEGRLKMHDCTVSDNHAGPASIKQSGANSPGGDGGGIYSRGELGMTGCTVSHNITDGSGSPGGAAGGGVYAGSESRTGITNSVVRDNRGGGDGGGIANVFGALKLSNSTVVFNEAGTGGDGGGGGIYGGARIRSTIVSSNFARSSASDVSGQGFVSSGYNYIGIDGGGCCFNDTDRRGSDTDPFALKLDPVTLIPLPGSPAIDAGLARDLDDQPVTTDRRGAARPFDDPAVPPQAGGDDSDIGAFERQGDDLTTLPTRVQFSARTSQVTEGCVQTEVAVTRDGPKEGTTEATYVVSAGTASQRGDFTYATGRVTFAPGEDAKTIPVLISEDAYVEGPEELIVSLTSVTGGSLGALNSIKVRLEDDDAADGAATPIDDDDATFVCQHYHDFLGRHADPEGQAFWTGQLASCGDDAQCREAKRDGVSAAFFLSIEFQQTGYFAIRVNKAAFGDRPANPRYLPFLGETQEVGRGVVVGRPGFEALLEANKQRYAEAFVARSDFLAAHGGQDAAQYVDSLFANAGAAPTQAERDVAVGAFDTGDTAGRAASLRKVVESGSVYNQLYNPSFVLMQYYGYLRRNPDDAPDVDFRGYDFWLEKLDQSTPPDEDARDESAALGRVMRAEMVKAFLLSAEYRGRFQGDQNRGP